MDETVAGRGLTDAARSRFHARAQRGDPTPREELPTLSEAFDLLAEVPPLGIATVGATGDLPAAEVSRVETTLREAGAVVADVVGHGIESHAARTAARRRLITEAQRLRSTGAGLPAAQAQARDHVALTLLARAAALLPAQDTGGSTAPRWPGPEQVGEDT